MANEENLREPWQAGQSGNPNGRPKGSKNMSTILREYLECELDGVNPFTGKKEKLSAKQIIMLKLIANAMKGDNKSINDILDRLEGKATQKTELSVAKQDDFIKQLASNPGEAKLVGEGEGEDDE